MTLAAWAAGDKPGASTESQLVWRDPVRSWRCSEPYSAVAALRIRACAHQLWATRARTASRTAWFPGRSWKGCSGGAEPHQREFCWAGRRTITPAVICCCQGRKGRPERDLCSQAAVAAVTVSGAQRAVTLGHWSPAPDRVGCKKAPPCALSFGGLRQADKCPYMWQSGVLTRSQSASRCLTARLLMGPATAQMQSAPWRGQSQRRVIGS